jgi:diacylglycerol kinase (ATP)
MDKGKLCIIFNPAAKGERARLLETKVATLAEGNKMFCSSQAGDAERLARAAVAEGFQIIVAAGGDGTLNEVVNGIAGSGATLGVLPLGTMNVFAEELGLPVNQLAACWEIILSGQTRLVDLAQANDRLFVQLAGVGLDAQTVQETDFGMKRTIGPLSYILSAVQIIGRPAPLLQIHLADGRQTEGRFILIGNGKYYGGKITFFKNGNNFDGLLDVLVFKNQTYLDIIRYLQGVFLGNHVDLPDIDYYQVAGLAVSSEQPVPVELDGEVAFQTPVEFRIAEQKLVVLAGA